MKNILLIGMPGSGKTSIGREIAKRLEKPFVDIDELIIACTGRDPAQHLAELGDDGFLDFESRTAQKIEIKNGLIASTGSVPLRQEGFAHLRKNAVTVWMDIPLEIIKARVDKRADKDSRIVGAQTMSFAEILAWRKKAYSSNHDIHFTITQEKPKEEVIVMILELLKKHGIS